MASQQFTFSNLQSYADKDGHINIAAVGKTGEGKSSTLNTILHYNAFHVAEGAKSVTKTIQAQASNALGIRIRAVDTVGLFDTDWTTQQMPKSVLNLPQLDAEHEQVLLELSKLIALCPGGIHAFLMVVKLDSRFTLEMRETFKVIMRYLGTGMLDYTVFILTKADQVQSETVTLMKDEIRKYLYNCGYRNISDSQFVSFDNLARPPGQIQQLFQVIEANLAKRKQPYTHAAFAAAQANLAAEKQAVQEEYKRELDGVIQEQTAHLEAAYNEQLKALKATVQQKAAEMAALHEASEEERHKLSLQLEETKHKLYMLEVEKDRAIQECIATVRERMKAEYEGKMERLEAKLANSVEELRRNQEFQQEIQHQMAAMQAQLNAARDEDDDDGGLFGKLIQPLVQVATALFGGRR